MERTNQTIEKSENIDNEVSLILEDLSKDQLKEIINKKLSHEEIRNIYKLKGKK